MTAIFVVGMPRSGTTLVQSLIATSTDVVSYPETHVFMNSESLFHDKPTTLGLLKSNLNLIRKLWKLGFPTLKFIKDGNSAVKAVHRILENHAKSKNAKYYLEKTPGHLYFTRAIHNAVPDSKFIFVTRDIDANVRSYLKVTEEWGKRIDYADTAAAISRWYQDTALCVMRAKEVDGIIVRYERIVDPQSRLQEINRMKAYLGIQISDDPEALKKVAKALVSGEEYWKTNNLENGIVDTGQADFPDGLKEAIARVSEYLNAPLR